MICVGGFSIERHAIGPIHLPYNETVKEGAFVVIIAFFCEFDGICLVQMGKELGLFTL